MARESVTKKEEVKATSEKFFANFNIYNSMAHYVARKLGIRPNSILDEWAAPELIVAFGEYANEETQEAYQNWKRLDSKARANIPKPQEYMVYFHK